MSSGLMLDREDTAYVERVHKLALKNRNWLRHGSKTSAGKIDEMLFDGATVEQLTKGAKTTKGSVYVHLNHLRKVHKLAVVKKDGVFRYDLQDVKRKGGSGKPRKGY